MRHLFLTILAGTIMISGPTIGVAAEPAPPANTNQAALPPGDDSFAARRDTYAKEAQAQLDDWRHRLDEWASDAKERGQDASVKAKADLRIAWNKTQDASRKLAVATEKSWDGAKLAFEKASRNLADEWQKATAK